MKNAKVNLIGVWVAILCLSLFSGVIAYMITGLGGNYDISGSNIDNLNSLNSFENKTLINNLKSNTNIAEKVTVDPNVFDYIAGIFDKILSPFKFMYRGYTTLISMGNILLNTFNLPPIFQEFLWALIVVIVVFGIVIKKYYLKVN